jgi:small subunit ribosomal protein S9
MNIYKGIGKRKTAIANVFLKEGTGSVLVNKKHSFDDFLKIMGEDAEGIKQPFLLVNLEKQYDIEILVRGGGLSAQLDAIRLAISKAICTINSEEYQPILTKNSFLRRDSRIKERRKYGLKKARKASQFSKR